MSKFITVDVSSQGVKKLSSPSHPFLKDQVKKRGRLGDRWSSIGMSLADDHLSFYCLYKAYGELKLSDGELSLFVSVPKDLNEAAGAKLSDLNFSQSATAKITMSSEDWLELGTRLKYAGLGGDGYWSGHHRKKEKEDKSLLEEIKGEEAVKLEAISFYPSSLATQEAQWLRFLRGDVFLHLDILGSYLLGQAILSLVNDGKINKKKMEKNSLELLEKFYSKEDDEDEENW